jgi:anaerobic glycerol-3-phosphate dehydrogenase
MNGPQVVVVGAGFAGTAAAWSAVRAGATVHVVSDRAGSSALYAGAADLVPWDERDLPDERAAAEDALLDSAELRGFVEDLGLLRLGRALVATREGVVRPALGADRALLDLTPLAGRRVGVLDVERDDWDAALLAKSFAASRFAERTGTSFVPVPIRMLRTGHERRISAYDFALLHDDPARLSLLAEVLRAERGVADAWLSGPWLGLEPQTPGELARNVGVPIGETTSKLGGPAGARFERARDRLFEKLGVRASSARVTRVESQGSGFVLGLADDAGRTREIEARGVVLACGGVAAGGIVLSWDPENGRRGFELAFAADVELALDGERLAGFGSLHGPSLEGAGFAALERVGIAVGAPGNLVATRILAGGLAAAGDCVADRARTVLQAVRDGLIAGGAVARD